MRKSGIILLVVVAGIFVAAWLIFTDAFLDKRMESLGGKINGARVELDGVDFSLIGLRMHWDRLQVTDPDNTWKNMFETGSCTFDIAFGPLLKKKFIIENLEAQGIRLNTDRKTDGKLPKRKTEPKEKSKLAQKIESGLEREKSHIPVFNINQLTGKIDIDDIWKSVTLQTPDRVEALIDEYEKKYDQWEKRASGLPGKDEFKEIQNEISSIQPDKIRSIKELEGSLDTIEKNYNRVKAYGDEVTQTAKDFKEETANIAQIDDQISSWIKEDYEAVLALAKLPDITTENVAKLLFGERIIAKYERIAKIIGKVRYYTGKLRKAVPKKKKPPRLQGQDIQFVTPELLPAFWIKNVAVSGELSDQTVIAGTIRDIVYDQNSIGRPTTFEVKGTRKDSAGIVFTGELDYREDTGKELFTLDFNSLPMRNISLTDFALLPRQLDSGRGFIESTLGVSASDFESKIAFRAQDVRFDFSDRPKNIPDYIYKLSRSIAKSIDEITFEASLAYISDELRFTVQSNLDDIIADRLEEILSEELKKAKEGLQQKVREEIDPHVRRLKQFTRDSQKEIDSKITETRELVQAQQREVEKKQKEIEGRMDAEKKRLQKMAEDEVRKQQEKLEQEAEQKRIEAEKKAQEEKQELEEKAKEDLKKLF